MNNREYNKNLFLSQSHEQSNILLQEAISNKKAIFWDNILITASNKAQANIYNKIINERIIENFIPKNCNYLVLPDRDDKRIGSGGALFCALAELYLQCDKDINKLVNQKNLILNSGGAAKRLPHSAPWGKLFSSTGEDSTVFDDLMISFAGIPYIFGGGGIIIVAADAFFRFNHTQFDLVSPYAVAFTARADIKMGTQHGVYLHKDKLVTRFLHKLSQEELQKHGAILESNEIDLDIGITFFGEEIIKTILSLITTKNGDIDETELAKYANADVNLSLYSDIIYSMAKDSTISDFLKQDGDGKPSDKLQSLRPELFNALHSSKLEIVRLSPGMIKNMGTTEEVIKGVAFLRNEENFIEDSFIHEQAKIGKNCLISGCDLPPDFYMPDNTALHMIYLNSGELVCRCWGVYDNIKGLDTWLGYKVQELDEQADSLWNARLFPVCKTQDEAIEWAQIFLLNKLDINTWKNTKRVSLSDTDNIDLNFMLNNRKERDDLSRVKIFAKEILQGVYVNDIAKILGSGEDLHRRVKILQDIIDSSDIYKWNDKMRLYICLGEITGINELRQKGFEILKNASASVQKETGLFNFKNKDVKVSLPIRVNLAGTWSDAPPYCFEHGGTMLNMAVKMNGKLPICVNIQVINEPVICLASVDLAKENTFYDIKELIDLTNLSDPFVLSKAALFTSGILLENENLKSRLKRLGGGLKITTSVDIPKGSGLGTSSILTGGIIQALIKITGNELSPADLSNHVLIAEQRMTSGGGWQDCIGGIFPGIKMTMTEPGLTQIYEVNEIKINPDELNARGFLLYTGQRRLARSLLIRVVSNYICNNPESIKALNDIQMLAYDMVHYLRKQNITAFGELLNEHMRLIRILDKSCSNLMLDHLMTDIEEFAVGSTLLGAAGGGFLYGILKENMTFKDLQEFVNKEYRGSAIRVYTCEAAL